MSEQSEPRPLSWHSLAPPERWRWFEQLWDEALMLRERYELPVRAHWWEDARQVEALAAFAEWVRRYDSGEWDDPPGKLALIYELERLDPLLRDGHGPLHPERDRPLFDRYVMEVICGSERAA